MAGAGALAQWGEPGVVRGHWACSACRRADLGEPSSSLTGHIGRMSERQSQAIHCSADWYKKRQFCYCGSEAVDQVKSSSLTVYKTCLEKDLSNLDWSPLTLSWARGWTRQLLMSPPTQISPSLSGSRWPWGWRRNCKGSSNTEATSLLLSRPLSKENWKSREG